MHTSAEIPPKAPPPAKLGEELPIFCEKCGYSLHGLPQERCEHCDILQFHCPECGHHQPINTLRPAAYRIIGRLRAIGLVWVALLKLNYFGWLLFAWLIVGGEMAIYYRGYEPRMVEEMRWVNLLGCSAFALGFGMVSRMLLLRWRTAWKVGMILAVLVVLAMLAGVWVRTWGTSAQQMANYRQNPDLAMLIFTSAILILFGSLIVWPIWVGLVRVLLPRRTGDQLLDWQMSLSDKPASTLGRE